MSGIPGGEETGFRNRRLRGEITGEDKDTKREREREKVTGSGGERWEET